MLWDRWKEQLCLQSAGLGPYNSRALTQWAGGSWPLNQGRGWGWASAALGSKRIFRLRQLVLGGDRSAAGACSPSNLERSMTEALRGVF